MASFEGLTCVKARGEHRAWRVEVVQAHKDRSDGWLHTVTIVRDSRLRHMNEPAWTARKHMGNHPMTLEATSIQRGLPRMVRQQAWERASVVESSLGGRGALAFRSGFTAGHDSIWRSKAYET